MGLIDTHCHLTSEVLYLDLWQVVCRARAAGVQNMITVAISAGDSCCAVSVADHYGDVYASIGIHPHEAGKVDAHDWNQLSELKHHPKVLAWGEIGLDYHYDFADRSVQQEVFARQLQLAKSAKLPVIIHCREAVDDVVAMLREHGFAGRKTVFHCFTGSACEAREIRNHGWWLSFTGIVTFKKSRALQDVARDYPLEQLMLETDAPYLTPQPHRKIRPNEPCFLVHTSDFLARLHEIAPSDMVRITTANAKRFFGLP